LTACELYKFKKNINSALRKLGEITLTIDSLDLKIIQVLQKNARASFVDIAKKLNVTPTRVQARFQKMKKAGLIMGSTLILDLEKLGVKVVASMGVVVLESKIKEVAEYIKNLKIKKTLIFVFYAFGRYNITVGLLAANLIDLHRIKTLINKCPGVIEVNVGVLSDSDITWDINPEKYFPGR
jgi:DNA-binding Lrp family transcriptional regulator